MELGRFAAADRGADLLDRRHRPPRLPESIRPVRRGSAASGFAGYFTLNGLGPGIQRRTRLGEKTAATALTLSLGASLLVAVVIWAGASFWARAWGIPDATWVIRVIGLTVLFTSCSIVPIALLRRGSASVRPPPSRPALC